MFNNYRGFDLVEAIHAASHAKFFHPSKQVSNYTKLAIVAIVTLLLWNMPAQWFGINNLTVVQQRIIAIFAFATLMWIFEVVASWATSVGIIVLMLLFCTDSDYPQRLNSDETQDCPVVLYMLGEADLNAERMLAVVGTRRATPQGRERFSATSASAFATSGSEVATMSVAAI